jgi:hypothetical protein
MAGFDSGPVPSADAEAVGNSSIQAREISAAQLRLMAISEFHEPASGVRRSAPS